MNGGHQLSLPPDKIYPPTPLMGLGDITVCDNMREHHPEVVFAQISVVV
eukprot:COSAG01_NODE_916_length_12760_cov_13.023379_19_plen_49_part_00